MNRLHRPLLVAGLLVAAPAAAPAGPTPADAPLTLQAVLDQARANSQQFRSAQLASDLATEDKKQARAALLPSVSGFSQYIYTQPNGTPSGVWVPNDGPRVYATWLNVHGDVFSLAKWAEYRGAAAAEAVARARADVAGRGLVATIVQNYYGLVAAQRKLASAQQSLREAQQFLDITQKQESGGEVAHSDVVKAQIQVDAAHARRAGRGAGACSRAGSACRCSSSPTSATPSPSSTICRRWRRCCR